MDRDCNIYLEWVKYSRRFYLDGDLAGMTYSTQFRIARGTSHGIFHGVSHEIIGFLGTSHVTPHMIQSSVRTSPAASGGWGTENVTALEVFLMLLATCQTMTPHPPPLDKEH